MRKTILPFYCFIDGKDVDENWKALCFHSYKPKIILMKIQGHEIKIRVDAKNRPYLEDINTFPITPFFEDKGEKKTPWYCKIAKFLTDEINLPNVFTEVFSEEWKIIPPSREKSWLALVVDTDQNNFAFGFALGQVQTDEFNRNYFRNFEIHIYREYQNLHQCKPLFKYACQQAVLKYDLSYIILYISSKNPLFTYNCYVNTGQELNYDVYVQLNSNNDEFVDVNLVKEMEEFNEKYIIFIIDHNIDLQTIDLIL